MRREAPLGDRKARVLAREDSSPVSLFVPTNPHQSGQPRVAGEKVLKLDY